MKKTVKLIMVNLLFFCCLFIRPLYAQNLDSLVEHGLQFAGQQLINTVDEMGDSTNYPKRTNETGKWNIIGTGGWLGGFFPGCLWYMYEWTSDSTWKKWAESWTAAFETQKNNTKNTDIGFLIFSSFGNGYRVTKRETYKEILIQAARSLALRYNPAVKCIESWNSYIFPVIIDHMMILEILFWASQNGGESELYDIAINHALRTMEDHVRPDGSTYHIVDYNTSTGEIIQKTTKQGYSAESAWSRGQAWGLYGFTMTYRYTQDPLYLETAQKIANYYVDNLPEDYVPYWDFNAPNIPEEEKDASAAAIAASGLFELSTHVSDDGNRIKYFNAACNILRSLCSPAYLAEGTNSSGILLHVCQSRPQDKDVDVSGINADYYFIEALLRYQDLKTSIFTADPSNFVVPNQVQLFQNFPNPFNPSTVINYEIPQGLSGDVKLEILNLSGQSVGVLVHENQSAGKYSVFWNGTTSSGNRVTPGIYFYRLIAGEYNYTRKMILVD
jgi:rhamnogalacturonyl hydrolase YesR